MDAKALAMASRLPHSATWPGRPTYSYFLADDTPPANEAPQMIDFSEFIREFLLFLIGRVA